MHILRASGTTSSLWNLSESESGPLLPAELLVKTFSSTSVTFSIPKFSATGIFTGNFSFNGTPNTAENIGGKWFTGSFYVDNDLRQFESYSQGLDVSAVLTFQTELNLLSGVDYFEGSATNFTESGDGVQGLAGNDRFKGYYSELKNTDKFIGGDGIDTSIYQGKISDYVIKTSKFIYDNRVNNGANLSGFTITDNVANRDGYDELAEVERLEFEQAESGGANRVALDVGPTQNAGSVYMIYKAAFNRAPDASGMGYWLAQKDAGSNIVTNIAQGFVNSAEFTAKYGTNPSNATYIDKLYQNVLGRSGDSGGIAYWNQQLDSGSVSKAAALAAFATLPEGASNVASLIANGIAYQEYVG